MANRRVVVAGGAGFIGSHICERLLSDGYGVICIDNLVTGRFSNIAHLVSSELFDFLPQDICAGPDVREPIHAVLHLASPASPLDYLRLPFETLRSGSIGTFYLAELARRHGARLVLASTSEVYGDPHVHPQPETYWGNVNPVGPRSVYDEAKRFSEAVSVAYRRHHNVNTAIVRIFNTFGPRMRSSDGRAVPTFIDQAISKVPITVAGDGMQTRSLCYIDDTVEALVRMIDSEHPGPINVGNPTELTMLELAMKIQAIAQVTSGIVFVPRPQDDPETRMPDVSLAGQVLDWKPMVPVDEGLRRTWSWHVSRERG